MPQNEPAHMRGLVVPPRVFHLCLNGWGIGIGLIAIFACLIHFLAPGQSPVDVQLGTLAHAYYIVYGAAGALILIGLIGRLDEVDALGLALFIGGLTINLVAVIATVPLSYSIPSVGTWLALMIGATTRLLVVTRLIREKPAPEPTIPLREAIRMALDRERDDAP